MPRRFEDAKQQVLIDSLRENLLNTMGRQGKMDPTAIHYVILSVAGLIAFAILVTGVAFTSVGRVAFASSSGAGAGAFSLLFLTLPALSTIILIIIATAFLTGLGILQPDGCIAIFSSVASFVLGAETQKRRNGAPEKTPDAPAENAPVPPTH